MKTILQIGEGNFLRAFAEYFIQLSNQSGIRSEIIICQPRRNTAVINALKAQNCGYHIVIRGRDNGQIVDEVMPVDCVSRCIDTVGEYDSLVDLFRNDALDIVISNTTEAGICFHSADKLSDCPDVSFPAKVTALLYERYKAGKNGVIFLPVELIENNGGQFKECIKKYIALWNLGEDFASYIDNECSFCNTLVDRIVTGHTEYKNDKCAVACEPYASWLIKADDEVRKALPFDRNDKRISFVDSLREYRARKVRILNGAHTMSVLAAYHMGFDIVRDMMQDDLMSRYVRKGLFEEVIPTINLPENELKTFAGSVLERFDNPFIDHKLLDISLNSVSKFKTRCLGTLIDYNRRTGTLPAVICFGLAALIYFYNGQYDGARFIGKRDKDTYEIKDSRGVLDFFSKAFQSGDVVRAVLSNKNFWDTDLTEIEGLYQVVKRDYDSIVSLGMKKAVEKVIFDEQAV